MTVVEQLEFYAALKGKEKSLISPEVDKMVVGLELGDKRVIFARDLYGKPYNTCKLWLR